MIRTGPISADTLQVLLTELAESKESDLELVAMDCWEPFKAAVREALADAADKPYLVRF